MREGPSKCESCSQPGYCCTHFVLNVVLRANAAHSDAVKFLKEHDLQFFKFIGVDKGSAGPEHVYGKFHCTRLGVDGRCTDYANRPLLCHTYQPQQDALCCEYQPPSDEGIFKEEVTMTTSVVITHDGPDHANVLIETVDNVRPPQKHTVLAPTETLALSVYKDMRLLITETQDDSTSGKQTSEAALAARIAAEKAQAAADLVTLTSEQVGDLTTSLVAALTTASVASLSTANVAALSTAQVSSTK